MQIEISAVKAGMVLAEAVLNRQGQVLLPGGTTIKDRHTVLLKTWGIAHLSIQGGEADSSAPGEEVYSDEVLARAKTRLEQRWTWKPRHPLEEELFRLAVKKAAEAIVKGK